MLINYVIYTLLLDQLVLDLLDVYLVSCKIIATSHTAGSIYVTVFYNDYLYN